MKKMSKMIICFALISLVFGKSYGLAVNYLYNVKNKEKDSGSVQSSIATVATPSFTFESQAQLLMEANTGTILYANNENEKLLPASVTKIMTLLLIMEQIDSGKLKYTDMVTCSKKASEMGGSQIWFEDGEQISIDDALKAICVVSANDVCVAMSELVAGSEENFVIMMNSKAKELGMENTHYENCHGIDSENHYTCAKDLAILARELITKHPDIIKYTSIWMDSLRNGESELVNTNKLIRFYDGATGLKTGYTSQALYNLVGTATRGNTTFISVILKCPSSDIRLAETKTLLDYGFAMYESKKVCSCESDLESIKVDKNIKENLNVRIESDVYTLVEKNKNEEYDKNIVYLDNIKAPILKGDVIGYIEIIQKSTGDIIAKENIIAENDISKSNCLEYIKFIFSKFLLKNQEELFCIMF